MTRTSRRMVLLAGCVVLAGGVAIALAVGGGAEKRSSRPVDAGVAAALVSLPNPPAPVALSDGWRYLADRPGVGVSRGWASGAAVLAAGIPVSIPHDFNPVVSRAADRGAIGWYAVAFTGPAVTAGRSWSVQFESVRRHAAVWLNGVALGSSSDPYAPFSLPATSLRPGKANVLVVRVDNVRGRGVLPEDWWNWGGITGPVSLQAAGRVSLRDLGVMPRLACRYRCASLLIRGTLHNDSSQALRPEIVVRVGSPGGSSSILRRPGPLLRPGASAQVRFRAPVRGTLALWSPASPALYAATVQTDVGGRVEQEDRLQVGLRSVQVRRGILYLNGRRLWLHGAAIHEDVQGRGAALSDGDIETIVSQLRSAGANVTRAHYLLSPRLLSALDAAGILVWAQPPVDHAAPELRTASGRAQALALLRTTILGDRNHPSVIVNSLGNELTPTPDTSPGTGVYLRQAAGLARRLDPGTPVALDTYCYPGFPAQRSYAGLDVLGISSYFGWYPGKPGHSIASLSQLEPFLRQSHARYRRQALVVSEYGAEGLFDGPATVKGSYEFQTQYLERTLRVLDGLRYMNGSIYWTLRDFAVAPGWTGGAELPAGQVPDGVHHKGLIAYDGVLKPAYASAQRLFGADPGFARGRIPAVRLRPRGRARPCPASGPPQRHTRQPAHCHPPKA